MRATLTGLKSELGLRGTQKFDANLQDRLAYHLLRRRGYDEFMAGDIDVIEFGKRLAMEWASLPVLRATKGEHRQVAAGQSYYAGDGVNKALVKTSDVATVLKAVKAAGNSIRPETGHIGPEAGEPMPIPVDTFPSPKSPATRPSFLALAVIVGLAVLAALGFWLFQQQAAEPAPALGSFPAGAPVPMDRPVTLFGGPGAGGGSGLFAEIGFQILLAFVGPLISAAATAAVGWVVYWWGKVLKTDFDQKSADTLHAALQRGILAAIEHFGARAAPAKLTAHAAEYANKWSGGTVKRFGLSHDDLQQLAEPHLAAVKLGGGK